MPQIAVKFLSFTIMPQELTAKLKQSDRLLNPIINRYVMELLDYKNGKETLIMVLAEDKSTCQYSTTPD